MATILFTGNKTKYLRKKLLDHAFGQASWTMPTSLWLALFSADPTSDGLLTNEITNGGYSRQRLVSGPSPDVNRLQAANLETGQITNLLALTFSAATEDWTAITHAAVIDNATIGLGNMHWFFPAVSSRLVTNTEVFVIEAGQLIFYDR